MDSYRVFRSAEAGLGVMMRKERYLFYFSADGCDDAKESDEGDDNEDRDD